MLIVGLAAGFLILVAIIIAGVLFLRWRKQNNEMQAAITMEVLLIPPAPIESITPTLPAPTQTRTSTPSTRKAFEWEIHPDEVEVKEELGRGGYGIVYKVFLFFGIHLTN